MRLQSKMTSKNVTQKETKKTLVQCKQKELLASLEPPPPQQLPPKNTIRASAKGLHKGILTWLESLKNEKLSSCEQGSAGGRNQSYDPFRKIAGKLQHVSLPRCLATKITCE